MRKWENVFKSGNTAFTYYHPKLLTSCLAWTMTTSCPYRRIKTQSKDQIQCTRFSKKIWPFWPRFNENWQHFDRYALENGNTRNHNEFLLFNSYEGLHTDLYLQHIASNTAHRQFSKNEKMCSNLATLLLHITYAQIFAIKFGLTNDHFMSIQKD